VTKVFTARQAVTEREIAAAQLIELVLESDSRFTRAVGSRPIRYMVSGGTTDVFAAGTDRVIKVTSTELDDCDVAELLWDRGRVTGWPFIYDFAYLDDDAVFDLGYDIPVCITVVERVISGNQMNKLDGQRLSDALWRVDDMHAEHILGRPLAEASRASSTNPDLDAEQQRWVKQLISGLKTTGRWDESDSLDTWSFGNVGLNKKRQAVWVDFGV